MITDQNDAVKVIYIYDGDQPLMRFTVNSTTGEPENPVFYLEDASGSVLGLANSNGALLTRFRYDGFGNSRAGFTDPASSSYIPAGAAGDFCFHGAWLEAGSGFYHMRARDYDPETGRFLQRDPIDGNIKTPESLHTYAFFNSNPYFYSCSNWRATKMLRRSTLIQYRREPGQLDAILRYARKHTYLRTAVFITFTGGDKKKANSARQLVRRHALDEGALAIIVSAGYLAL